MFTQSTHPRGYMCSDNSKLVKVTYIAHVVPLVEEVRDVLVSGHEVKMYVI